jgi:hypothetical protein
MNGCVGFVDSRFEKTCDCHPRYCHHDHPRLGQPILLYSFASRHSFSHVDKPGYIPPPAYHRPSILQPIYKHLPPKDIVCLKAGDEIIVVFPVFADNGKVVDNIACILTSYTRAFELVVDNTLRWLHPGNCTSLVFDIVRDSHTLLREGRAFLKYSCCVCNFAEQEYLERKLLDHRAVDMYWEQGAGINLSLCSYSMQRSVMMEFCHVGYLEIYGRIKYNFFLSKDVGFNNNTRNVSKFDAPLLEQLSLNHGCRFGTLEVLWKYYRSVVTANQRE